jgi:4-hydroxybenzoate polyprenyltransferase
MCWCIGYDTIYALQDREDDALVGIRSSARALGSKVKPGVTAFYAAALAFWALAFWLVHPDPLALLALLPVALHLAWQALSLDVDDGGNAWPGSAPTARQGSCWRWLAWRWGALEQRACCVKPPVPAVPPRRPGPR